MQDQKSIDATLSEVEKIAKDHGDVFTIKVVRKDDDGPMRLPTVFAILEDARLNHIAMPQAWVSKLVGEGGGLFELQIHHPIASPMRMIGVALPVMMKKGPLTAPIISAIDASDWNGPKTLKFPERAVAAPQNNVPLVTSSMSIPPPMQPQVTIQDARNASSRSDTSNSNIEANRLLDAAAQLAKQREEIAEERHRLELAKVTNAFEAKLTQMQMMISQGQATPREKAPSMMQEIIAILPVLLPLIMKFIDRGDKQTELMFNLMRDNGEKQREALKELADTFAKKAESNPDHAQMFTRMSETLSSMAGVTFQILHQARETMGAQEPENPMVAVALEGLNTLKDLGSKYMDIAAKRPVLPLQPQTGRAVPGQRVQAQPPQPNAVTPPQIPVNQPAPEAQLNNVDMMEQMIRQHVDVNKVTEFFFQVLQSPEMQLALTQVGGDPADLMKIKLGAWLLDNANFAYATSLGEAINAEAVKRGFGDQPQQQNATQPAAAAPMPAAAAPMPSNVVPIKKEEPANAPAPTAAASDEEGEGNDEEGEEEEEDDEVGDEDGAEEDEEEDGAQQNGATSPQQMSDDVFNTPRKKKPEPRA